jgi:ABC-type transporter Mla MlaB component
VNCLIGVVDEGNRRILRLAGHLSVAQVPELLRSCAEAKPVELDLADLVSADAAGIEALRRVRKLGATLVGAPGYIKMKVDSADPEAPASGGFRRLG